MEGNGKKKKKKNTQPVGPGHFLLFSKGKKEEKKKRNFCEMSFFVKRSSFLGKRKKEGGRE